MYFLPRRLTYCSQILSNYNVPVVASSTGDPAGFLLSVSSSRRLSECLRPTTQKGEETLLVRPRTTYWASRTSSERVDQGNQQSQIHSEKAWTCLKMESSAIKVWFGQSKKSHVVRGNLL